jgi:uncharacterized protein YhaN
LLRLDLLRFGPFTDTSIVFEPDPSAQPAYRLHIVFGPNEAGKSTALRAYGQLLFGIPHQSSDDFLHTHKQMRVGALLESGDGRQLECIRRKGRVHTLRAANDSDPIAEEELTRILGGIDQRDFLQRFGVQHAELAQGGEAILQEGGDLGQLLFSAGSGIVNLRNIQDRLVDETRQLFKPAGSTSQINRRVAEFNANRKRIREAQLSVTEFQQSEESLRFAEKRKSDLDEALSNMRTELHRLERLHEALPLIAERRQLLDHLNRLDAVVLLQDNFSDRRTKACTELAVAIAERDSVQNDLVQRQKQLDSITVPKELLEAEDEISKLHSELGGYRHLIRDLEKRRGALAESRASIRRIRDDLKREEEWSDQALQTPSKAQRQQILTLAQAYAGLDEAVTQSQRQLASLQNRSGQVEEQLRAIPTRRDTGQLETLLRRAQQVLPWEQSIASLSTQISRDAEQLAIDVRSLPLWSGTPQELEILAIPDETTLDRFSEETHRTETQTDNFRQQLGDLQNEYNALQARLDELRLQQDIPSEGDLARARELRTEAWNLVRQDWRDGTCPKADADRVIQCFPGTSDLASAYEASVRMADEQADRLRREADRVVAYAGFVAASRQCVQRMETAQTKLDKATHELERNRLAWRNIWRALRIEPLTPKEMRDWRKRQQQLSQAARSLRDRQKDIDNSIHDLDQLKTQLRTSLQPLSDQPIPDTESLPDLVRRAEDVVTANHEALKNERDLRREADRLARDIAEAQLSRQSSSDRLARWQEDWQTAVTRVGMGPEITPTKATIILDQLADLDREEQEAQGLEFRISAMERDIEQYQGEVGNVIQRLLPVSRGLPPGESVEKLRRQLADAEELRTKRDSLAEEQGQAKKRLDALELQVHKGRTQVEYLCQEARCDHAEDLGTVEEQSQEKRRLAERVQSLEQQLLRLAAGTPLPAFVGQVEVEDADTLSSRMQQLSEEISARENELGDVRETIGSQAVLLRQMDSRSPAALIQEDQEILAAQLREDVREYTRLRLATAVLRRAIDRFRDRHKGPVLEHASQLFQELTLGSFSGLRADFDEQGTPLIVGLRSPTDTVGVRVEAMSDGTRDQLYLALRLALLETDFRSREPMPLLVDDILITFDDARAAAALRALARFAIHTQVIFFTHHEHLLELAQRHLQSNQYMVHRLICQVSALDGAAVLD